MNARLLITSLLLSSLILLGAGCLAAQPPSVQPQRSADVRYVVTDLGTLGGSFSSAADINDRGEIDGYSTLPGDAVQHSFVIKNGTMTDLGTLGGPSSISFMGLNAKGQVPGAAEVAVSDPNAENFCGLDFQPPIMICLAFITRNGVMTPLSTLGGNNASSSAVANSGEVSGYAETSAVDPNCPPPQMLQFLPVIWSKDGVIQALSLYQGDTEGAAFGINNRGEVVGTSGICGPFDPQTALPLVSQHALLWRHGQAIDLGNLGGAINNAALAISDRGVIVGTSDLPGDTYFHAFLWRQGKMRDLGTLSGDVISAALAVNNRRQITGISIGANGNPRAFLWERGVMFDLNTLVAGNAPLYLLQGIGINKRGEIVGSGSQLSTGNTHAFLAIPCELRHENLSLSGAEANALRQCP